jgi:NADPH:quinone reductase-like Zn-dependent oxidoreductase
MSMVPAVAATGVGVAFDTVGGETTKSLVPTVREGRILRDHRQRARPRTRRASAACARSSSSEPGSDQLTLIAELVAAADVRVEVAEVLSLTDIERAHELSESGHTRGKIILAVVTSA